MALVCVKLNTRKLCSRVLPCSEAACLRSPDATFNNREGCMGKFQSWAGNVEIRSTQCRDMFCD